MNLKSAKRHSRWSACRDDDMPSPSLLIPSCSIFQVAYLEDSAEIRAHFVKSHGMLAVVDALQTTRSRDILGVLLRIVNIVSWTRVRRREQG